MTSCFELVLFFHRTRHDTFQQKLLCWDLWCHMKYGITDTAYRLLIPNTFALSTMPRCKLNTDQAQYTGLFWRCSAYLLSWHLEMRSQLSPIATTPAQISHLRMIYQTANYRFYYPVTICHTQCTFTAIEPFKINRKNILSQWIYFINCHVIPYLHKRWYTDITPKSIKWFASK